MMSEGYSAAAMELCFGGDRGARRKGFDDGGGDYFRNEEPSRRRGR